MNYAMFNAKATTLPYGMLISHIMQKWNILASGPSLGKSVLGGRSSIRNQKMVCYNRRILCNWEIDEASPEDRVQIDLIRGIGSSSGNVIENVADKSDGDQIREVDVGGEDFVPRERLDTQEARQKKDRKYLMGIMKFLSCFGKGEGSNTAVQRYLVHSDSDPEGDEQQTVSGTPVGVEDYGFHHPSSGDGDGGMGLFPGGIP
ncbi:hypothetical protein LIER_07716 [Lithospermum erythrorhizon]|uniref:Uncharacterized protein n=1 Tax=Lithospermum erythrorhizon TaxID=34254 RepID=A0AAV3PD26_LITER